MKAEAQRTKRWTNSAYVDHIIEGLRSHNAPAEYIETIIAIAVETNRVADDTQTLKRAAIDEETARIREMRRSSNS